MLVAGHEADLIVDSRNFPDPDSRNLRDHPGFHPLILSRVARLAALWDVDGPILANRFADSRAYDMPDSCKSFHGSRTEPLILRIALRGGLRVANRRFEAIRANRSHVMKIGVVLRIDSRESPRSALRITGPSKNFGSTLCQNCLQWGGSNLVATAEWLKVRLLDRDYGKILSIFPGKTARHRVD